MNYWSIDFRYDGIYSSDCSSMQSNKDLCAAENAVKIISDKLNDVGVLLKHQYSWTDGSCYKYAKGAFSTEDIQKIINANITKPLTSALILQVDCDENPYKNGYATLEQYMKEE